MSKIWIRVGVVVSDDDVRWECGCDMEGDAVVDDLSHRDDGNLICLINRVFLFGDDDVCLILYDVVRDNVILDDVRVMGDDDLCFGDVTMFLDDVILGDVISESTDARFASGCILCIAI